jgi:hypothetical protein
MIQFVCLFVFINKICGVQQSVTVTVDCDEIRPSLCLTLQHSVEVHLHTFITLALYYSHWSSVCRTYFILEGGGRSLSTKWTVGCVGRRVALNMVVMRTICASEGNRTPDLWNDQNKIWSIILSSATTLPRRYQIWPKAPVILLLHQVADIHTPPHYVFSSATTLPRRYQIWPKAPVILVLHQVADTHTSPLCVQFMYAAHKT